METEVSPQHIERVLFAMDISERIMKLRRNLDQEEIDNEAVGYIKALADVMREVRELVEESKNE